MLSRRLAVLHRHPGLVAGGRGSQAAAGVICRLAIGPLVGGVTPQHTHPPPSCSSPAAIDFWASETAHNPSSPDWYFPSATSAPTTPHRQRPSSDRPADPSTHPARRTMDCLTPKTQGVPLNSAMASLASLPRGMRATGAAASGGDDPEDDMEFLTSPSIPRAHATTAGAASRALWITPASHPT